MTTKDLTPEEQFDAAFEEAAAARLGNKTEGEVAPAPQAAEAEGQTEQPGTEAAGDADPAPAAKTEVDPVEELRRKLAEAEHRERSASNRISAFHKKLNEAQAKVAELERKLTEAPAPQPKPSEQDPELQNLLSEMPELGKVVEKLVAQRVASELDPLQKKIQTVEAQGRPAVEFAEREAIRREIAPVDDAFPGWRQIVFDADGEVSSEWSSWLATKSPAIQAAYEKVTTAQDAIDFLQMYHRDKGLDAKPNNPANDNPAPKPKPKTDLARTVGIPSRPAAAPINGVPAEDDFEGSYKYFAEKRLREQAAMRR